MNNEQSITSPVLLITQGDTNGIGWEIILKTFNDNRIFEFITPVIYGSAKVAAYYKKMLKISTNLNIAKDIDSIVYKKLNIINCNDDNIRVEIGKSTSIGGKSALEALNAAVDELKKDKSNMIVTAPINKDNIQLDNFTFPGHTEYFANQFSKEEVLMLMVYEKLKIGVVTGHVPISKVSENLTEEKILKKLKILNDSLKNDFAIRKPLIAVLGLNPHAGDNGLIGNEEKDIIIPALEKANKEGIVALGPYPADGFFHSENFQKFDAILAMYHDQGMLPFKILSDGRGVNYTAGIDIIRTSPAHGTAYDIVGKNSASPESFKAAVYLALDINKNRNILKDIEPLEKKN